MKKTTRYLGAKAKTGSEQKTNRIVNTLFPVHPLRIRIEENNRMEEAPLFTEGELNMGLLKLGETPDPEGISAEVIQEVLLY